MLPAALSEKPAQFQLGRYNIFIFAAGRNGSITIIHKDDIKPPTISAVLYYICDVVLFAVVRGDK